LNYGRSKKTIPRDPLVWLDWTRLLFLRKSGELGIEFPKNSPYSTLF